MTSPEAIHAQVKAYILAEFLPGEDPAALTDETPLVTGGILDSIAALKLVEFLESTWDVELEAHEVDAEHLDTLPQIVALVRSKRSP